MTKRVFADTNIFVRLLTLDEPQQVKASVDLFNDARLGKFVIYVNVVTIAELVWMLESSYQLDRSIIRRDILALQNTHGLEIENATLVVNAMDMYLIHNIDFGDAYNICWMQANDIKTAYTFDKRHFSRVAGIDVKVPGQ